jgi:spermidine synthase
MKKYLSLVVFPLMVIRSLFSAEFTEDAYKGAWKQSLKSSNVIYENKTKHQDLVIFDNPLFGRTMILDGIFQITQNDEFIYSEMISHVPILAHGNAKKVLIIGGGDGAVLEEVLKHKDVEKAVLVDIDDTVVELSKKYLPMISKGAFENPRSEIIIADGFDYVQKTQEKFDIIIVDSTDPFGPGKILFSQEFYDYCKNILNKDGIFVSQNVVPFFPDHGMDRAYKRLNNTFENMKFYLAPVPVYGGGHMAFGFATDNEKALKVPVDELKARYKNSGLENDTLYYTPKIHNASFALPKYVKNEFLK